MRTRFLPIASLVLVFLSVLSTTQKNANAEVTLGLISVPLANVHDAPEAKARLVTQVLLGEEVRILEKRDYRFRIAIPDQGDVEGWIHQEAVQVPRDDGRSFLRSGRLRIVISVPKTPALILDRLGDHHTSLYAGTRLPVVARNADGYRVQFPDRTIAVIPEGDAKETKSQDPLLDIDPLEIAQTARKFQGIRYLAGGRSAQGMDGTGLIYIVYRIYGIDLDMSREAIRTRTMTVRRKELQPGDILLFHGEEIGLYVGGGRFLHGLRKAGIQLAGVQDHRYASSFQRGLRFLGAGPEQEKRPSEMTAEEIMEAQTRVATLPLGRRITYWAERFIGTPYDTDPLGLYVRTNRIVADEKADCMYLTFRVVELARSTTPGEAIDDALDLRFKMRGVLQDGLVMNYADRFQYGEDMVFSGKWGLNITDELDRTISIPGSRGRESVLILPKASLASKKIQGQLREGDIIYWVKDPKKRVVGEIVSHLSFVRVKGGRVFLVHAGGFKDSDQRPGRGEVREVLLTDYLRDTKFIGAFVTRFEK